MPKLLEFKNRQAQKFEIRAKSSDTAEIVIYSPIGQSFWEEAISAKQFNDEMKKIDASVKEIIVRINSPGGDVFDGIAIYNRLKQHKAKKTVYIDGLAASIASIIALAGDEIIMGEGALYMVHLPMACACGNRNEIDNLVQRLMDVEEQMVGIYARKSGLERTEVKALLEAETWMGADEAMEQGFIDTKMEDSVPIAASAIDVPWFKRRPKNFKSEAKAVDTAKDGLKAKIAAILASKK